MSSQDAAPNPINSTQRVKVYRLNENGKWDDQGTGHVTVDYVERSEDLGLSVIDEDDNETLLLHRISSDDIYRKQEDTIISWRDSDLSTEVALSFQETTGCSYIWLVSYRVNQTWTIYVVCKGICTLAHLAVSLYGSNSIYETFHSVNTELRELPPVELSNLPLILKTVVESGMADHLRVTELILHDQFFFRKLVELFRVCEDLENIDDLHLIFRIVRGIILLNSSQIFEKIFGDELIMDIIGCLEYDPEVHHVHHRNILKDQVVFKEVIPIKDPVVISKIHQTYRVGYLKDVILPGASDEPVLANLNSIIHSNNAIVVSLLKDDNSFIKELFASLKSPTTSTESKKTLIHFLHEFCTLSKSLQMVHQLRLFRDLGSGGIFDIIADILQSTDKKLVSTGRDILILFMNLDPNILRSHVSLQEGVLFGVLVKSMLTDFGDDTHCQFFEILRTLLDQNTSGPQKDTVVEIFYEKHLGQIIDVITSSCPSNGDGQIDSKSVSSDEGSMSQTRAKPETLLNICDLLCFCVLQHPYRIKCNFLLNNVIDKVLYLTRRREKYLVVAAIRFVKTLISHSDEHLMNHFVENNLFKPIVDAFVANGDRYNLLNSVVLDLFEYIRKENLKVLLKYLVDTFWIQLAKFEGLSSISALKVQYDQSLESTGTSSSGSLLDKRKRIDERALEKEEEDYFNEDSREEDSASANTDTTNNGESLPPVLANGSLSNHPTPRSSGLVDYDDDEDDDNFSPRPIKSKSDEDELGAEYVLKRKLASKEELEAKRLQRSMKGLKPRGVLKALCSNLSEAKKTAATATLSLPQSDANDDSVKPNIEEKGSLTSSDQTQTAEIENHNQKEEVPIIIFADGSNETVDNRDRGDEFPLLPPNSSPEMAVRGS
ncbi:hypothetical protein BUALT_Bualt14G0123700 [Buddleja alternifolia]|uniref:Serine/threonine-protein phosphatase 4 regulatory subunit 3-like central domain-containing protein n=1 Tax=Buddleja alternifolia TaxID=168488 RepID=A0AAV6WRP8_9LAMI|nr:hypothetical protein BUALT_Bualt14G0123700 [Buddleja alternifolia]